MLLISTIDFFMYSFLLFNSISFVRTSYPSGIILLLAMEF